MIPVLTEFEIIGYNVYEIPPKAGGSLLAADKSIYVVDIPDSDRAPHQAKRDFRYYVRLGGRSQPASHRLIEDIRNRQRHPVLDLASLKLDVIQLQPFVNGDPPRFSGPVRVRFHVRIRNKGKLMATNSSLQIIPSVTFRWSNYDDKTIRLRGSEPYWELIGPLYPGMEIAFWTEAEMQADVPPPRADAPGGGPWSIGRKRLSEVKLSWRLFADHAPIKHGEVSLEDLKFTAAAGEAIEKRSDSRAIRKTYEML